jgi:hypothetical protein
LSIAESIFHAPAGIAARFSAASVVFAAWAAVCVVVYRGIAVPDSMFTDDAMRLVQVRDLIAGQGWFDLVPHRLNPSAAVAMHWSRLVDLPIAALILMLTPLFGQPGAEVIVATLWPPLLLLPALTLVVVIARRLVAEAWLPALIIAAFAGPALAHFRPGALDHHGVQLVLLLAAVAGTTFRENERLAPIVGGVAVAASLAVGLEMAPALIALLAAVGLRWAIAGERAARGMLLFAGAMAVASVVFFAMTVAPQAWTTSVHDAFSFAHLLAMLFAAAALAGLAAFANRVAPTTRLALAIGLGAAAALVVAASFPEILRRPYAGVDPRLTTLWLDHIAERQSLFALARNNIGEVPTFYVVPIAALLLSAATFARLAVQDRLHFLPALFVLLATSIVAVCELRGAPAANLLGAAVLAANLTWIFAGEAARLRRLAVALLFSGPVLGLAGTGAAAAAGLLGQKPVVHVPVARCLSFADVAPLARLPAGRVLTSIEVGPYVLAATDHAVFAGPYHRDVPGISLVYDVMLGTPAAAAALLRTRNVDYLALCRTGAELRSYQRAAPDGLAARIARGERFGFLVPVEAPDTQLRIFRVAPE